MSTYHERRMDKLAARLRARTRHDGTALPGFEQNVATIRAELEQISERVARAEAMKGAEDNGE